MIRLKSTYIRACHFKVIWRYVKLILIIIDKKKNISIQQNSDINDIYIQKECRYIESHDFITEGKGRDTIPFCSYSFPISAF